MACPVTLSGIATECKDIGGIKEVYIIDRNKVSGLTLNPTTLIISGITMSGTTKFSTYKMNPQTGNLSSKITNSSENNTSFIETTVNLVFAKMTATKNVELKALRIGELAMIVRDNNDNYWYLGYDNPVELMDGTAQSGTAFGDLNGYNINLVDRSYDIPYSVASNIISSIIS